MLRRMDWQETTALLIVAATAATFAWARFRTRAFRFQRATHCGCSSAGSESSRTTIRFHVRKGEQPRVIIKMK